MPAPNDLFISRLTYSRYLWSFSFFLRMPSSSFILSMLLFLYYLMSSFIWCSLHLSLASLSDCLIYLRESRSLIRLWFSSINYYAFLSSSSSFFNLFSICISCMLLIFSSIWAANIFYPLMSTSNSFSSPSFSI